MNCQILRTTACAVLGIAALTFGFTQSTWAQSPSIKVHVQQTEVQQRGWNDENGYHPGARLSPTTDTGVTWTLPMDTTEGTAASTPLVVGSGTPTNASKPIALTVQRPKTRSLNGKMVEKPVYYNIDGGPKLLYKGTINVTTPGKHAIRFFSTGDPEPPVTEPELSR